MFAATSAKMTKDTVQRIARDQGRFALTDADAEALVELVNDLQNMADAAAKVDRRGLDPATEYVLEDWSHD